MGFLDLRQFETSVLLTSGDPFNGSRDVRVQSGSRMLISLLVITADPGATVSLGIGNTFEVDNGYESILTINQTGVGRQKEVLSDFHNLFQFVITVTGGAATYKVGVSMFDNAMTTRIENADINVDVSAGSGDNVAIADRTGTKYLAINDDGSINEVSVDGPYNVVLTNGVTSTPVAAAVTTEVASYTVPVGKQAWLQLVDCGGENIAEYEVLLNGDRVGYKRTWFSGGLNLSFDYRASPKTGLHLVAGDTVSVMVDHYRPAAALFEARIQVVESGI